MNKQRRKEIDDLVSRLNDIQNELAGVAEEEQDYFDSMPDNLADSEKALRADEVTDSMFDLGETLGDVIGQLEDCK